jgi:ATP-dependent protease HslVU (ClpYQ) peptidase subunit
VELAKDWRTGPVTRHLEAVMIVADDKQTFLISEPGI